MKITHVTTRALRTPADNPLVVGLPASADTRDFVTLELGTDQGLTGIGLTFFGGALMRPHPVDYLAKAGPRLRDQGFRQMKMQCGSEPTVAASIERVRVMREAIGPDIDLMCDINQLWSVNQAIEVGRRIEPYHLLWLEDPTTQDVYPGLARSADALTA